MGLNKVFIKGKCPAVGPYINANKYIFVMKLDGNLLNYDATSFFNSKLCNTYIVYKYEKHRVAELFDYLTIQCLFRVIKVVKDKVGRYNRDRYTGRGIDLDANGRYGMGVQGFVHNVITFGGDNRNSLNDKNKKHDFTVLGRGKTQFVENLDAIPKHELLVVQVVFM